QGQPLWRHAALARHARHELGRRDLVGLEHETGRVRPIAIAEFLEQSLLRRRRAPRTGTEGHEGSLLQAPAGVLAAEAGKHRIAGGDEERGSPAAEARKGVKRHPAETAEADLRDAPPGLNAATGGDACIDDAGACFGPRYRQPEAVGITDKRLNEWCGKG